MTRPIIRTHDGITVVRDDMFPGGTKARFIPALYEDCEELVYASPCEGGAQTAIATVAKALGKRAIIFVAKRAIPHDRTRMAFDLGATVVQVSPGYLTVVRSRAAEYAKGRPGTKLAPFGLDYPQAADAIRDAARSLDIAPDEVWCAAGSGVLARGLALAWPDARRHVVRVGRELSKDEVAGAKIHETGFDFSKPYRGDFIEFPCDPHYDAKAFSICRRARGKGAVVFWNVTGPADVTAPRKP